MSTLSRTLRYAVTLALFFPMLWSQQRPYALDWNTDGWITGGAAAAGAGAYVIETNLRPIPLSEIASLDRNAVNPVDRLTAGNYSAAQSTASDILVGLSIVSPVGLLLDEHLRNDFFTLAALYAETEALAAILPSIGKGTAKRIRPYVYNTTDVPSSLRTEPDAQRSFFSRHSTFAFSTAVFTSVVYSDYFPDSRYTPYVWAGSLGLAASVALLRVTSGSHFISDVVVGAAVGSAVGYLVPAIHRTARSSVSLNVAPLLLPPARGITVSLRF